jgi:8-oxo-dGTP pyrophosphatase MutT (NUDIX family)
MHKIIAAGGIVTNTEGKILMIFRRGKWDLPKGKLDKGETIAQCAVREVEEETGLKDILLGNFLLITEHQYQDPWLKTEVIKETHWYTMKITKEQILVPQTEEDITAIQWVNRKELIICLQHTYANIITVIETFLKTNDFSA